MTFFQTMVVFFLCATVIGFLADRFVITQESRAERLRSVIYNILGVLIIATIIWTVLQFILQLPSLAYLFPIEAAILGVIFAMGLQGGFQVLKDRAAQKKKNKI